MLLRMPLIDFAKAGEMLGVSPKTVGRMCERGELKLVAIPGKRNDKTGRGRNMKRVDQDEVKKKIAAWATPTPAPARGTKTKGPAVVAGRARRQAL